MRFHILLIQQHHVQMPTPKFPHAEKENPNQVILLPPTENGLHAFFHYFHYFTHKTFHFIPYKRLAFT